MAPLPWSRRRFPLANGVSIPAVGLGTFKVRRDVDVETAVLAAVAESGYRHIDTAAVYRNERFIADAAKKIYANPKLGLKAKHLCRRFLGKFSALSSNDFLSSISTFSSLFPLLLVSHTLSSLFMSLSLLFPLFFHALPPPLFLSPLSFSLLSVIIYINFFLL
jgi:hypothetical protein